MSTYTGTFIVEPNQFPMRAERFILRDDEIAFDFRYKATHEGGEEFKIDDKARLQPEGFYRCDVTDPNSGYELDQAIIYILKAKVQKRGCLVEGFWHEKAEGAWKFSGLLSSYLGPAIVLRGRERRLSESS